MDLPKERLNSLDLFSGIGGNSIALSEWVNTVAYCENDRFAQAVLLSNMSIGRIPARPIWDDVRTLKGGMLPRIEIISGGFPCQDISVAGNGKGLEGERSGLVFEIFRLIDETGPKFVFLENVPAIRTRGGERVVKELASRGYDCRWDTVSASEVGAPHKRNRWFLLAAHADSVNVRNEQGRSSGTKGKGVPFLGNNGETELVANTYGTGLLSPTLKRIHSTEDKSRSRDGESERRSIGKPPAVPSVGLADTNSERLEGTGYPEAAWKTLAELGFAGQQPWPSWLPLPTIRRGDDGFSNRAHRIKCCGNAVVPNQAKEAFKRLMGL